ncbi:MAG: hypothetical protein Q4G59_05855 [Planctomycetia bacterium]|nr:hypothetical protein [Planctomycetia bacterium]
MSNAEDQNQSSVESPAAPSLSPAVRARLQTCFEYGNKKMQSGNFDYATEMFIQCVLGDPGNLIYMQTYIGNLRVKYGNNKKGASFGLFKSGGSKGALKTAEVRKKWEDVLKSGCEALKTNPWDDSVFFSMGRACLELGYNETGLAYLKHAVECNPEDIEINRYAAVELGAHHIYDQAIACWQRILNKKPDDLQAKKCITDLLLEQTIKKVNDNPVADTGSTASSDDTDSALSEEDQFELRLKKTPKNRSVYEEMSDFFFQKGNLRKAEDICQRALKVFPDDEVFTYRAIEFAKMRAREVVERARQLYAKDPSDATKAEYTKAREAYEQKNLDLIKLKLKRNPNSGQAHYEYGNYLMQHKQFKEAINEFQAAKVDVTIQGECLLALAFCFQSIKQYRLAIMHYDGALKVLAGEGEYVKRALYEGAKLAYALGDLKKADEYAHRLASIDFSYKDLGDLLDKIDKKVDNK